MLESQNMIMLIALQGQHVISKVWIQIILWVNLAKTSQMIRISNKVLNELAHPQRLEIVEAKSIMTDFRSKINQGFI